MAARLKQRDPSALRELYQQEERRAFALAYRLLQDSAAAEDAVQDAFTQLWERSERLTADGGRVESLLMTIVRRRAVDQVRRRSRTDCPLPDADLLQAVDERATDLLNRVEEKLTSARVSEALNRALTSLPPEQRLVLSRVYVEGMTLNEVAMAESVPLGTVKSRLRLAMTKLAGMLGEHRDR
jgi:RNA polymerase sigma factor (sigma-70 family)